LLKGHFTSRKYAFTGRIWKCYTKIICRLHI